MVHSQDSSKASHQHFVPQFILRKFAQLTPSGSKKKHRITVFDLQTNKIFVASLSRVAGANRFYDYTIRSGKVESVDPLLTNIEGLTAPAWQKLVNARTATALSKVECEALALFIATLAVRGPATRAVIQAVPSLVIRELRRRGEDTSLIEKWLQGQPGDDETIHANSIRILAEVFPVIAARIWRLYAPPHGRFFCTSDSPVVRFNDLDYGPRGKLGLLQPGITLEVALAPDLLLLVVDPQVYALTEGPVESLTEENLLHYNGHLAWFANRYLYARSAEDFDVRPGMWHGSPHIEIVQP
jgi:hypothetical protein